MLPLLAAAATSHAQLRAWYPLDDGTATDATGNGHDGTINGSPTLGPGIVGQSLRMSAGDTIVVPGDPGLRTARPAVMLWLKLDATPTATGILARTFDSGAGYRLLLLRSGRVQFDIAQGAQRASVRSPFQVMPGVWTAVLAAYDGADLNLYMHGELVAQSSAPGLDPSSGRSITFAKGLDGHLDEIRLGTNDPGPVSACLSALKSWHAPSQTCLDTFTNVAPEEDLEDRQHRSFGATLVDIDQDGWIDLYYVNGAGDPEIPIPPSGTCPPLPDPIPFRPGSANALHMNLGDGTFGIDIAPTVGLADQWNAMRHVWADYDRDGLRDTFSHNFLVSTLYKQVLDEPLLFLDWNAESGTHVCLRNGTGASFVDLDFDGFLDLHVVEYDASRPAAEHVNQLYLNDGLGGFTEVTEQAGLDLPDNPMGQAWADFDNDGDLDFFMPNSHEVPTRLYRNNGIDLGTGVPTFTDIAASAGVAVIGEPHRGVGASWGDYNNDRRLDLLFSREGNSRLFRNNGPDANGDWSFTDVSGQGGFQSVAGLKMWGGGFADLDNDGWLDIVLTNRYNGANRVLLNNGDETFREVSATLGMELSAYPSMGFVAGDRDNDGDVDVVIVSHGHAETEDGTYPPNFVWENNARGNNWLQLRLTGVASNLEAVGARIEVQARLEPGGPLVWQSREISAGTGFFSDFPRVQTFGLGKAEGAVRVRISWPSGVIQDLDTLKANRLYEITEPSL